MGAGRGLWADPTRGLEDALGYASKDRATVALLWIHATAVLAVVLVAAFPGRLRDLGPVSGPAVAGLALLAAGVPTFHRARAGSHAAWRFGALVGLATFSYLLLYLTEGRYGVHAHVLLVLAYAAVYADRRLPVGVAAGVAFVHTALVSSEPTWLAVPTWTAAEVGGRLLLVGATGTVSAFVATSHLESVERTIEGRREAERLAALRRVAAETSQANEERILTVFDAIPEGVVLLDQAGNCVFANLAAARLLAAGKHELARRSFGDPAWGVVNGSTPAGLPFREVVAAGRAVQVECEARNGLTTRSLLATLVPLKGDHARAAGVVVTFLDVTDRKRDLSELEATRRQLALGEKTSALGSLVSGVFHELRTPLTYVQNNLHVIGAKAERLKRQHPEAAPVAADLAECVASALEGTARINHLVTSLRRFARAPTEDWQPVPLNAVVQEAVDLFRRTHPGETQVEADLHATLPCVVDPVQVQQIVLNLLDNAADAMARRGRVRVATRPVPGGAEVVVADAGPGIPPDLQARIFDEFFTTKPQGTGLGLAIVKRIVEDHGGSVSVHSEPGKGTRFTVFFGRDGPRARLLAKA